MLMDLPSCTVGNVFHSVWLESNYMLEALKERLMNDSVHMMGLRYI